MPQAPEPSLFSFLTADFGSSLGFGSSILLAFLVGFHGRVRTPPRSGYLSVCTWLTVCTTIVAYCGPHLGRRWGR
jgi:hypothetical protein